MKVFIPYVSELQGPDARLARLVEFLGIPCESLRLTAGADPIEVLKEACHDPASCLVVNPRVMKTWLGTEDAIAEIAPFLLSHFRRLLVHGVRVDPFDNAIISALSGNRLQAVRAIDATSPVYAVAPDSKDICAAFSGLSFGPVNPVCDHVFSVRADASAVRRLISIGGSPFMAILKTGATDVLFVGCEDVVDLDTEVADTPMPEYFSRLMPHAMALRYAAGDECWRAGKAHAAIIIDDPLLRKTYGFLDFDSLLRLAKEYGFHVTIAFIPHNFRRNSSRITRMFQLNPAQLSICFHGNDHTGAEFASTDSALLKTLLRVADERMDRHRQATGLPCDRVMVFPQGNFSLQAMKALKARDFYAAVNTILHPTGQPVRLRIAELARPAVLRYGDFPLFIRNPISQITSHDIAFNLFFGRPILIVEHHDVFQHPESLVTVAAKIKSVAGETEWANLATVVGDSFLTRRTSDGTYQVRAYSGRVRISNDSDSVRRYSIEWCDCDGDSIEQVLVDGTPCPDVAIDDAGIRLSVELPPRSSRTFSVAHRNVDGATERLSLGWKTRAFLRRRLSEVRDNYLSRNQHVLNAAKMVQQRFLKNV